jgi:hypothetical protein
MCSTRARSMFIPSLVEAATACSVSTYAQTHARALEHTHTDTRCASATGLQGHKRMARAADRKTGPFCVCESWAYAVAALSSLKTGAAHTVLCRGEGRELANESRAQAHGQAQQSNRCIGARECGRQERALQTPPNRIPNQRHCAPPMDRLVFGAARQLRSALPAGPSRSARRRKESRSKISKPHAPKLPPY